MPEDLLSCDHYHYDWAAGVPSVALKACCAKLSVHAVNVRRSTFSECSHPHTCGDKTVHEGMPCTQCAEVQSFAQVQKCWQPLEP